nr:ankyrin repeat domain-containing protein [uncultured Mucilaginibacter sp.]
MIYPLHDNVLRSDIRGINDAIAQGCDLDELDGLGNSPLHWAVMRGDIETVKILLKANAHPNVLSSDGFTPKWSAVDFGLVEIAALLTTFGGRVLTNENFERTSWSVFKEALGESLPEEEKVVKKSIWRAFKKLFYR